MNYNEFDESLGDLSGVTADDSYSTIPPGQYVLQAIKTELKDSRSGGRYVSVQFEVLGPDHVGRKVFENYNIMHGNPQTVEIALRQIKQWVMACGYTGDEKLTMGLLRELEGKEFVGQVKVEKDKTGQYGDSNRIARYLVPGQAAPGSAGQSAPMQPTRGPAQAPQQARANQQPWMR